MLPSIHVPFHPFHLFDTCKSSVLSCHCWNSLHHSELFLHVPIANEVNDQLLDKWVFSKVIKEVSRKTLKGVRQSFCNEFGLISFSFQISPKGILCVVFETFSQLHQSTDWLSSNSIVRKTALPSSRICFLSGKILMAS